MRNSVERLPPDELLLAIMYLKPGSQAIETKELKERLILVSHHCPYLREWAAQSKPEQRTMPRRTLESTLDGLARDNYIGDTSGFKRIYVTSPARRAVQKKFDGYGPGIRSALATLAQRVWSDELLPSYRNGYKGSSFSSAYGAHQNTVNQKNGKKAL